MRSGKSKKNVRTVVIWLAGIAIVALVTVVAIMGASVFGDILAPAPTFTPAPAPTFTSTPAPTATPVPTPTLMPRKPTPAPETGFMAGRQDDIFSDYYVETANGYRGRDVSVTWTSVTDTEHFGGTVVYYVADIYVMDATEIRSCFAGNTFATLNYRSMAQMCSETGAVIAVSGDYARNRAFGLVIRDGVVYRDELDPQRDIGVLFRDGTFETYLAGAVPLDEIMARDPWQCWCFGPELLDKDGKHKTEFNSDVTRANPRAVFGYYEPGHYCFVVVDGRSKHSKGLNMEDLSLLMEMLGCTRAINLDGGATAQLAWRGKVVNKPAAARRVNDIIYVGRGTGLTGTPPPNSWRGAMRADEPLLTVTPAP